MSKIYVVDIEAVETRYTGQWKFHVPELLKNAGFDVEVIEGPADIPPATSPGAFLNFGGTNIYKAVQIEKISRLFCNNSINSNDYFLFTDAWHPGIINLRYMAELLQIPVRIGALWHAGSYDPQDFLGRLVGDKPWVRHAEKSFYFSIDDNYFATDFHIKMFDKNLLGLPGFPKTTYYPGYKYVRTGWPMEYMSKTLDPYKNITKRDLILFPHRLAPEKQVDIFKDIQKQLPQYEFIVCQENQLTKQEYHTLLGQSKIVFSASLQETLGIGCYEGCIVDAVPVVPDRLSYSEMYIDEFKYPEEWTKSYNDYIVNRDKICYHLDTIMKNYDKLVPLVRYQTKSLTENFFSAVGLLKHIANEQKNN